MFKEKDNKTIKIKVIIDLGVIANFISLKVTKYVIYKIVQMFCSVVRDINKKIIALVSNTITKEIEIVCLLFLSNKRYLFREMFL